MNWSRRHNLAAGLGLILLVNAVVLAGVAWNRRAPADSQLQLSERELSNASVYWSGSNNGVALRLEYRWPQMPDRDYSGLHQLTAAKMAELGFSVPTELNDDSVRRYRRQLDRDALLVLELNGPLFQQALQQAQEQLDKSGADLAALPDNPKLRSAHKEAQDRLDAEQTRSSRLFVIDAGLDLQALRARYPDHQHYAILRGKVSPWGWRADNSWQLGGSVDIPVAQRINLPQQWHALYANLPERPRPSEEHRPSLGKAYSAELQLGRRLEPWLSSFSARRE